MASDFCARWDGRVFWKRQYTETHVEPPMFACKRKPGRELQAVRRSIGNGCCTKPRRLVHGSVTQQPTFTNCYCIWNPPFNANYNVRDMVFDENFRALLSDAEIPAKRPEGGGREPAVRLPQRRPSSVTRTTQKSNSSNNPSMEKKISSFQTLPRRRQILLLTLLQINLLRWERSDHTLSTGTSVPNHSITP